MKAYRYFKLEIYQVGFSLPASGATFSTFTINKIRFYDTTTPGGTSFINNVICTNDGVINNATSTRNVITDETQTSSYWSGTLRNSANTTTVNITKETPVVLIFDAVNSYVLRTVELYVSANLTTQSPHVFAIFGSTDGVNWEQILYYKNWFTSPTVTTVRRSFTNEISGKVTAESGNVKVCVLQLSDGLLTHVATVTPSADGTWRQLTENTTQYVVVYLPTAQGIRPMADGVINSLPYVI